MVVIAICRSSQHISKRRRILQIRSIYISHHLYYNNSNNSSSSGQWVTGSLSGAKNVSKLVPPNVVGAPSSSKHKTSTAKKNEARLLVSGPDATGIVASFSQLLYGHGCDIVDCTSESSEEDDYAAAAAADTKNGGMIVQKEHSIELHKHQERMFFQRILFDYSNINVERSLIENEIESMCLKFGMKCQLVSHCYLQIDMVHHITYICNFLIHNFFLYCNATALNCFTFFNYTN